MFEEMTADIGNAAKFAITAVNPADIMDGVVSNLDAHADRTAVFDYAAPGVAANAKFAL
jgi:hypothetical protein